MSAGRTDPSRVGRKTVRGVQNRASRLTARPVFWAVETPCQLGPAQTAASDSDLGRPPMALSTRTPLRRADARGAVRIGTRRAKRLGSHSVGPGASPAVALPVGAPAPSAMGVLQRAAVAAHAAHAAVRREPCRATVATKSGGRRNPAGDRIRRAMAGGRWNPAGEETQHARKRRMHEQGARARVTVSLPVLRPPPASRRG